MQTNSITCSVQEEKPLFYRWKSTDLEQPLYKFNGSNVHPASLGVDAFDTDLDTNVHPAALAPNNDDDETPATVIATTPASLAAPTRLPPRPPVGHNKSISKIKHQAIEFSRDEDLTIFEANDILHKLSTELLDTTGRHLDGRPYAPQDVFADLVEDLSQINQHPADGDRSRPVLTANLALQRARQQLHELLGLQISTDDFSALPFELNDKSHNDTDDDFPPPPLEPEYQDFPPPPPGFDHQDNETLDFDRTHFLPPRHSPNNAWVRIVNDDDTTLRFMSVATLRLVHELPEPGLPPVPVRRGFPDDDAIAGVLDAHRGWLLDWVDTMPSDTSRNRAVYIARALRDLWKFVCYCRDAVFANGTIEELLRESNWQDLFQLGEHAPRTTKALVGEIAKYTNRPVHVFVNYRELVYETYYLCVLVRLCWTPLTFAVNTFGLRVPFVRSAHDPVDGRNPEKLTTCIVLWPSLVRAENDYVFNENARAFVLPVPDEPNTPSTILAQQPLDQETGWAPWHSVDDDDDDPVWVSMFDATTGRMVFYNQRTNETTLDRPSEYTGVMVDANGRRLDNGIAHQYEKTARAIEALSSLNFTPLTIEHDAQPSSRNDHYADFPTVPDPLTGEGTMVVPDRSESVPPPPPPPPPENATHSQQSNETATRPAGRDDLLASIRSGKFNLNSQADRDVTNKGKAVPKPKNIMGLSVDSDIVARAAAVRKAVGSDDEEEEEDDDKKKRDPWPDDSDDDDDGTVGHRVAARQLYCVA